MTSDDINIEIDRDELKRLDRQLEFSDLKVARSLSGKAIRAAGNAAKTVLRSRSPSRTMRTKFRTGKVSLFRVSKKGGQLPRANGGFASIGIGIPSPQRVPPSRNRRAYFIAHGYERGFPGQSSRARGRRVGRRVERARGPFMTSSVARASNQILFAFLQKLDGLR